MKKIIIISILIITSLLILPTKIEAKTLNDLKAELKNMETKHQMNENKKQMTRDQINKRRQEIEFAENEIEKGRKKIAKAKEDIKVFNKKIAKKNEEIKELMRFMQLSDGENAYLEYAFGAKTFTDFIYRVSVIEQLSDYNKKNIKEMNRLIEQNKKLQLDMAKREKDLKKLQKDLEVKLKQLGNNLEALSDATVSIQDEIKSQKAIIKVYEKQGCKPNQDIKTCINVPLDSDFVSPLRRQCYISSNYGYRGRPCRGCSSFHPALDISGSGIEGSQVYASSSGMVAAIIRRSSCGGNQVFIHHNVKGKNYTTQYSHLQSINVKVGQQVTKLSVVGRVGGGRTTPWDGCSTGGHLHFAMSTGHYLGSGYSSYSKYISNTFNPKRFVKVC